MKIERFHSFLNEELIPRNKVMYIVNTFFNECYNTVDDMVWEQLDGSYIVDKSFEIVKKFLIQYLTTETVRDNERFTSFVIDMIRNNIVKFGGKYHLDRYFNEWKEILANLLEENVSEMVNNYGGEWPMNKQQIGMTGDDAGAQDYTKDNKFQEIQEQMKLILKPIIEKKNKNASEQDIEKTMESFFKLGNDKSQAIKRMVDGCKDTKKCAQDIINTFMKYVKINFNPKDNVHDVEDDTTMTSESVRKVRAGLTGVCGECDGKGKIKGKRCWACKGTGMDTPTPPVKKKDKTNENKWWV
jgi:hypothetical protein